MGEPGDIIGDAPLDLRKWWHHDATVLRERLYRPSKSTDDSLSMELAKEALRTSTMSAPDELLPVTFVDDRSFACLVLRNVEAFGWRKGQVVRWHLDEIEVRHQGAVVDVDLNLFMESLIEEHGLAWGAGYKGIIGLASRYNADFVENGVIPKPHDLRPFQLACQNVIIGLAAFQRDARIDGLAVPYWQTCDVPHVATNEGNRALAALMLCDAFQSGGTMEIDFARHPERKIPASLRRFGRTVGVDLGLNIPGGKSISPAEARALFLAVTPMPDDLRRRCKDVVDAGICSVERLCYSLLSPIWGAEALDFLLACCGGARIGSILEGGAEVQDRKNRGAEMELMRAALMVEMLIRRLDSRDLEDRQDEEQVRLFEDTTYGVSWRVLSESSAIEITGFPAGPLPWQTKSGSNGRVVVLPRPHPISADYELVGRLVASGDYQNVPIAILTAADMTIGNDDPKVLMMRCPTRIPELDAKIERNLVSSLLGRA